MVFKLIFPFFALKTVLTAMEHGTTAEEALVPSRATFLGGSSGFFELASRGHRCIPGLVVREAFNPK